MAETVFFTEQFRVMDCDCDMNHRLTPGAFLRMAQQISTDQCESIGMNDDFYRENHAVFLLAKLALQMDRVPRGGEVLTLVTMPEQCKRAVFKRVTEARDEKGERVALLDSRWVLVDTGTRRILRRPPQAFEIGCFEEEVSFTLDVSIQKHEEEAPAGQVTATYSRCDTNGHMNNTRYADAAADALPMEVLANGAVKRLVISYHNELPAGQSAELVRGRTGDGSWYVAGQREDGRPCFEAVLTVE